VGSRSAGHEAVALQVVDDHGDVAARLQDLATQLALVERAEVPQRLERAEAAGGEAGLGERPVDGGVDVASARDSLT
jgi:hypothetical protein